MRGAIDLGALAQSKKDQSMATQALANAPAGVGVAVIKNVASKKISFRIRAGSER